MVTEIFRTPHVSIDFEDRNYEHGQPIDVVVYVDPGNHEVDVRAGRIRLECEVRRFEEHSPVQSDRPASAIGMGEFSAAPSRPHYATVRRHENHVVDSLTFAENTKLPAGLSTFEGTLQLKPDIPLDPGDELIAARVTAHLDIPHGRDVHAQKNVKLDLT